MGDVEQRGAVASSGIHVTTPPNGMTGKMAICLIGWKKVELNQRHFV